MKMPRWISVILSKSITISSFVLVTGPFCRSVVYNHRISFKILFYTIALIPIITQVFINYDILK